MLENADRFEISVLHVEDFIEELVTRAEAGETIILTRDGKPVACIGPATTIYPDRGFGVLDEA
jgi:antitoxin (DNA-binding transcriptional repressor) of toxin-antitoxin stability system